MAFSGTLQQLEELMGILNRKDPYVYVITSKQIEGVWYFFDLEDFTKKPFRVMWISHITPAFKFQSEQAVEEFRSQYLSPRRTEIVRLEN